MSVRDHLFIGCTLQAIVGVSCQTFIFVDIFGIRASIHDHEERFTITRLVKRRFIQDCDIVNVWTDPPFTAKLSP